jgi:hypothetical protein
MLFLLIQFGMPKGDSSPINLIKNVKSHFQSWEKISLLEFGVNDTYAECILENSNLATSIAEQSKVQGKCCAQNQTNVYCVAIIESCAEIKKQSGTDENGYEEICGSFCDGGNNAFDFCGQGLSTTIIIVIVVGCVVVVGIVAFLIYWFAIRPKSQDGFEKA